MTDEQVVHAPETSPKVAEEAPGVVEAAEEPKRFTTLDDIVKQRRIQHKANKAAKQAEKAGKRSGKIVVKMKDSDEASTASANAVVMVYNLPQSITKEKMREIVKDSASVYPASVELGKPIKVGFNDEDRAAEFTENISKFYCKETGKNVVAKMKSNSVTLVKRA